MFKRRKPLTKLQHMREMCWPSMGWRRAIKYSYLRVVRLSDTTHSISLGMAIGVAIAFCPILGTHFLQAALFAWFLRANVLCAIIGTFVGNPWTFPFLWWGGIKFGAWIFNILGLEASETIPHHIDFSVVMNMLWNEPFQLLLPWTIGAYVLGIISMPFVYVITYRAVLAGKLARKQAKIYTIHKAAREATRDTTEEHS